MSSHSTSSTFFTTETYEGSDLPASIENVDGKVLNVSDLSSSLQYFGWLDYLIFVLMLVVCSGIGIYFGFLDKSKRRNSAHNVERRGSEALEYLVGGRQMKVFPVSLSLVASYISGISLLGSSTEIYVYGTQYAFMLISSLIAATMTWHIFLPVFYDLQLTSTYEYLELRFDKKVRLFGSVLFVIGTVFWLPIVIYVPALAFNQVTGINIHIITPIVCVVCIFYTCLGGLKAVVWTDVIQSFIMVGSILVVMIKGTSDVGGLGEVIRRNAETGRFTFPDNTIDPTVRISIISVLIGGSIHWVCGVSLNQVMVQRYLAVPSLKASRRTLIYFVLGVSFILVTCMYNGLLIYAKYHDCDPLSTKLAKAEDQLVPLLVMETLGVFPGLPGLFVAGVFSAALSSLSTGLNSLAAVALEDFCKPYVRSPLSERQTAVIMKSVVVIFGIICVGLVFVVEKLGMVLQLSMSLGAMTSGPVCGIFVVGMLLPWFNTKSILSGSISAFGIMAWICVKAQYAIAAGELIYPKKPVSTSGCTYSFIETLSPANVTTINDLENKSIYHISFLWYTALGATLTIILTGLASFVFGRNNPKHVDQNLLAPFLRKFITPEEYLSVRPDIKERESVIRAYDVQNIKETAIKS